MKTRRLQIQTTVALLAALSFLAMFLEVPLLAEFLKYEPSDVVGLVAGFALGPVPGVVVILLRNVLRLMVGSEPIGLLANAAIGASFVFVAGSYYQRQLTRRAAAWSLVLGGAAQVLVSIPVATVAINAAKNAGILAAQILSVADPALRDRIISYKEELRQAVLAKRARLDASE